MFDFLSKKYFKNEHIRLAKGILDQNKSHRPDLLIILSQQMTPAVIPEVFSNPAAKIEVTSIPSSHRAAERDAWWVVRNYTGMDALLCCGSVLCCSAPHGCTGSAGVKSQSSFCNLLYKPLHPQTGPTRSARWENHHRKRPVGKQPSDMLERNRKRKGIKEHQL